MFKNLSKSTKTNYNIIKKKLYKNYTIEDLAKIKTINKIYDQFENKGTSRNYIIVIQHILKYHNLLTKKLKNHIHKIINDTNKLSNKYNKTEKEQENWLTMKEIQEIQNKYKKEYNNILTLDDKDITKQHINTLQKYMILLLYTGSIELPPRRNDYAICKINCKDKNFNCLDLANQTFVFRNYKTVKTYKTITISIPQEIYTVILRYLTIRKLFFDSDYFLLNILRGGGNNKLEMSPNTLTKYINSIFDNKKISSSMLRKIMSSIYTPNINPKELKQLQDISYKMGHSVNTHNAFYIK